MGECWAHGEVWKGQPGLGAWIRDPVKFLDFILRMMSKLLQCFKWRRDVIDLDSRKISQCRD